jgi:hypothetical protein
VQRHDERHVEDSLYSQGIDCIHGEVAMDQRGTGTPPHLLMKVRRQEQATVRFHAVARERRITPRQANRCGHRKAMRHVRKTAEDRSVTFERERLRQDEGLTGRKKQLAEDEHIAHLRPLSLIRH